VDMWRRDLEELEGALSEFGARRMAALDKNIKMHAPKRRHKKEILAEKRALSKEPPHHHPPARLPVRPPRSPPPRKQPLRPAWLRGSRPACAERRRRAGGEGAAGEGGEGRQKGEEDQGSGEPKDPLGGPLALTPALLQVTVPHSAVCRLKNRDPCVQTARRANLGSPASKEELRKYLGGSSPTPDAIEGLKGELLNLCSTLLLPSTEPWIVAACTKR